MGRRCIDSRTCDTSCQKSAEESIVALRACIEQDNERRIAGADVLSACYGVESRPAMGCTRQVQKKQCISD